MEKQTVESGKSGTIHRATHRRASEGPEKVEPIRWWQRAAIIAGATGGGLLAASFLGVGPAALAGAAGYFAYRELSKKREASEAAPAHA